jgi:hypothetical protein
VEYLFWLIAIAFILFLLGIWVWLIARIWKVSAIGAVLTFFFTLPAFYYLYTGWGDEENDIREPFFANLAVWILAAVTALFLPAYQSFGVNTANAKVPAKSNPEMERWCREKHDAEYSTDLGTCVELEPGKRRKIAKASGNLMEDLQDHFADNDLELTELETDPNNPQAQKLEQIPDLVQVRQFQVSGQGVMPTILTIGECSSAQTCTDLAARMQQPGSPMAVSSNGKLLFMALTVMGDAAKIDQAQTLFAEFAVQ